MPGEYRPPLSEPLYPDAQGGFWPEAIETSSRTAAAAAEQRPVRPGELRLAALAIDASQAH